ncbi:hypothetical protein HYH03_003622 [Edaphochlamys debaryana]|uniref:Carbohydrate kinase PfkB domain-containing protein n=1 Tax=Edaphochlamys debaryana TaxID=47281 RepID=A0A835Y973_9CHLO|nr:hypothetical protein HYH03_003622 [Edaphochlamys debaryana]|eukprot:KAG2498363.1 hypothetical protein HYH03_003622 [Edaphochlamys debaryana]
MANHGLASQPRGAALQQHQQLRGSRCAAGALRCPAVRAAPGRARVTVRADASAASQQQGGAKGKGKVLCIGEALFDLIADQKGVPRHKVKSWTPYAGGAPANVATACARLGLDVAFATALGDDALGRQLVDVCKGRGVDVRHVHLLPGKPTREVFVTRDNTGDREFAGFGLPGTGPEYADAYITKDMVPVDEMQPQTVVVTGTLGLSYPATAEALRAAVAAARERRAVVLVDVNWRPVFWEDTEAAKPIIMEYLQHADLIKLSDADLEALLGMKLSLALINPGAVAAHFPSAKGVLITAGQEGAAYAFRGPTKAEHSGVVRSFDVGVTDTTGAGDAFTAGFIYKMVMAGGVDVLAANPALLKEAVVFASAAGASTCTRAGAMESQPTLELVDALYETSKKWYNFW